MPIIIIYYQPPAPNDYLDNVDAIFKAKKTQGTPFKSLGPLKFYGKRSIYKVESISC